MLQKIGNNQYFEYLSPLSDTNSQISLSYIKISE